MATHYPLEDAALKSRESAREEFMPGDRVERHAAVDRAFHWITAIAVFVLLGTGLLPVVGIRFAWVEIHWIAGVLLTLLVLFHTARALFWQKLRCILLKRRDLKELRGEVGPGKYTVAQKLMHHAFTLALVTAVATGVLMLVKVQTPFFARDPYLFSERGWGIIHALHDLATLLTVTLVIIHVYFAVLPEKRMYLRAMVQGWVTGAEMQAHYDGKEPSPRGKQL